MFQLFADRDEGHHDLEHHLLAFAFNLTGGFKNRANLHARDFGEEEAQPAAAETEHRVSLANLIDVLEQSPLLVDFVEQMVHLDHCLGLFQTHLEFGELAQQFIDVGQEFMKRRIQQPNGNRKPGHLAEDADEVAALQRKQFLERLLARAHAIGEDHLAHGGESLIAKEHMLGAAEADAFSAKAARRLRIQRRVAISTHAQPPELVGPLHQLMKIRPKLRLDGRHFAEKDAAG